MAIPPAPGLSCTLFPQCEGEQSTWGGSLSFGPWRTANKSRPSASSFPCALHYYYPLHQIHHHQHQPDRQETSGLIFKEWEPKGMVGFFCLSPSPWEKRLIKWEGTLFLLICAV
ncbi:hypothetical protein CH063_15245 [Colletotrichum higginsianum]|uniref:Uncharacterized protein n=1 Tax=Colletotrichum higginsianum (strain IMI 349063) TaxID=759273 RepID=H1W201_COLHI|nr:hypothetical protein CH063_15245 [Colletotrichum higginsianum]